MYKENPKTKGSGILCAIPQTGQCPNNCKDCFFQSGRSYLEPLDENLPNLPGVGTCRTCKHWNAKNREKDERAYCVNPEAICAVDPPGDAHCEHWQGVDEKDCFRPHLNVVRVNDGLDSNVDREHVILETERYPMRFFNTAKPDDLEGFPGPVVLTLNPGVLTDENFFCFKPIPKNLMFVRFRANSWNLSLADKAVSFYTPQEIPVVLTFMAYHNIEDIPLEHRFNYIRRKRTLNEYWAIRTRVWREIMDRYFGNKYVHSCGKIEGERGDTHCRFCGNCLREYFATMERMR